MNSVNLFWDVLMWFPVLIYGIVLLIVMIGAVSDGIADYREWRAKK